MRRIYHIFQLALVSLAFKAQNNLFQKVYALDYNTIFNDIIPCNDGGYLAAASCASADHLLIKLNATGQVQWSKKIGNMFSAEAGYSTGQLSDGYFLLGTVQTPSMAAINFIRLDNAANVMWNKIYYDTGYSALSIPRIRRLKSGSFILAATYTSQNWSNGESIQLIKTDKDGNVIWSKRFADTTGTQVRLGEVEESYDGNSLMVAGTTGYGSLYILSCDTNGNIICSKRFFQNINNYQTPGRSVCKTSDGNFLVASSSGYNFPFVIKIDKYGNVIWSRTYVNANIAAYGALSIEETSDNGIAIGLLQAYLPVLVKTNNNGDVLWSKTYFLSANYCYSYPFLRLREKDDKGFIISTSKSDAACNYNIAWLIATDSTGMSSCNMSAQSYTAYTQNLSVVSRSVTASGIFSSTVGLQSTWADLRTSTNCSDVVGNEELIISSISKPAYPNPSIGEIFLQDKDQSFRKMEVFDEHGGLVCTYNCMPILPEYKIDLKNYSRGVYLIKCICKDNSVRVFKICKTE